MPYVEGFGTYPFGEEWLFDAVGRSYLPVLEEARDLTVTVTPVLADQLEAPGVAERMEAFLRSYRLEAAEREALQAAPELRPAAAGGGGALRSRPGPPRGLRRRGARGLPLRRGGAQRGAHPLRGQPRRCCRWSPPPRAGACRSTPGFARTVAGSAPPRGSGFRSAPTGRESSRCWPSAACASSAPTRAPTSPRASRLRRRGPRRGWSPSRSTGEAVDLVWSPRGYPSDPVYADFHRLSMEGMRLWSIGGGPYDPAAARARAESHAGEFADAVAQRLRGISRAARQARPGHLRGRYRAARPLVVGGPDLARGGAAPRR